MTGGCCQHSSSRVQACRNCRERRQGVKLAQRLPGAPVRGRSQVFCAPMGLLAPLNFGLFGLLIWKPVGPYRAYDFCDASNKVCNVLCACGRVLPGGWPNSCYGYEGQVDSVWAAVGGGRRHTHTQATHRNATEAANALRATYFSFPNT